MAGDEQQIQISHVYAGTRFIVASNLFVAQKDFDAVNPVYGVTREDNTLGLGFVLLDNKIFGRKNWVGQVALLWHDLDTNIDFYDASSSMISIAAQYRF